MERRKCPAKCLPLLAEYFPLLQWTAAGEGPRFAGIVHHTDADCEYAYDRQSKIGKLDKAGDEAIKRGWLVVDMKQDWIRFFRFSNKEESP
jgi:hypothetical protein